MERKRFSILFFIKKTRLLANGEAPIRLRITYSGQFSEVQIKRSIPASLWSQKHEQSTGNDKRSKELNSYLEVLRIKLFQIHQDMESRNLQIDARKIKERFIGNDPESTRTICSIFKEHNERCRELIGKDYTAITICRYDNCLKYLKEVIVKFHNQEDLPLRELSGELVRNYEFYLKTAKKCQQNTVIRYMKCFKKIINMAIANEWMTRNPFAGIKFHENVVHKEFLTQEEIDRIYKKCFEIPRLELIKDVFIFCCYTGLAFIDVQNLKSEHISTDSEGNIWIRKTREKTNNLCIIPLLQIPLQILEKYRFYPLCQEKGVLLPVMCNQRMNSYLKEIADLCGIKKNLTMHTARHRIFSFHLKMSKLQA